MDFSNAFAIYFHVKDEDKHRYTRENNHKHKRYMSFWKSNIVPEHDSFKMFLSDSEAHRKFKAAYKNRGYYLPKEKGQNGRSRRDDTIIMLG